MEATNVEIDCDIWDRLSEEAWRLYVIGFSGGGADWDEYFELQLELVPNSHKYIVNVFWPCHMMRIITSECEYTRKNTAIEHL